MADYWHKAWACPFYVWSDKLRVSCEGGGILAFPDAETAVEYMDTFCACKANGWRLCSFAASLLRYYERKDGKEHEKR